MVYSRKTRLFNLPGADIITLTNHLEVAPETRGWRKFLEHLQLSVGEVRMCEVGGGAATVVEIVCQSGWTVGRVIKTLEKIGNQEAACSLRQIIGDDTSTKSVEVKITGSQELQVGDTLNLKVTAPRSFTDVQWYFGEQCLVAEKSRTLTIDQVSGEDGGMYKVRLESDSAEVKWAFIEVKIIEENAGPVIEDLEFLLQPQDYHIKEGSTEAHFFVDVRPYGAQLQWYCEEVLMHGKTQPYLCVTGIDHTAHRRQYKCTASYDGKTIISDVALIRWSPTEIKEFTGTGYVETASDKVALIIGNQSYWESSFGDIVHAENDAKDISEALRKLHFKVVSLINLTRDEMMAACDNFYKLLSKDVYGVFYFAGHGFESAGENYLVPVDTPSEVRVEHCIKAQHVLHRMQFRETKLNLLLLDMCREYANIGGVPGDIQPVRSRGNTAIGFACGPGSRAYGSENDKNGIYVKYLKEHITKNITVTNLLDSVNKAIGANEPSGYQQPHYQSSIIKNISLNDPIDTTNHTAEFHHRSIIWTMANKVDREEEVVHLHKIPVHVKYTALFSNVLHLTFSTPVDDIQLDTESRINGIFLQKVSDSTVVLKNIQKLIAPFIEISIAVGFEQGVVRIERPLFAKITANRLNFGYILNANLSLARHQRHGENAGVHPNLVNRGCSQDDVEMVTAAAKDAAMKKFDNMNNTETGGVNGTDTIASPGVNGIDTASGYKSNLPSPPTDHQAGIVYPFIGIYLFPRVDTAADILGTITTAVEEDNRLTGAMNQVSMTTTLLNGDASHTWIEIVLRERDCSKSACGSLQGTHWNDITMIISSAMSTIADTVVKVSSQLDVSEMWITDHKMYRQLFPSSQLVIDVPPYTLPIT